MCGTVSQSTLGATEDGIMTAELLERLFMEQQIVGARSNTDADQKGSNVSVSPKVGANGAPVAAITEVSEFQQKVVNEESVTEVEVSQHRVFLLGENRWEEPSRIAGRNKQVGNSKTKDATTKCLTCRGEGRLLCTECDGTGEPNIEPQFLEWVDEGMKCPYCEGVGFTVCDNFHLLLLYSHLFSREKHGKQSRRERENYKSKKWDIVL